MRKSVWILGVALLSIMTFASFKKGNKKGEESVIVLFEGTSLDGWRGYNRTDIPSCWAIDDGALRIIGGPNRTPAQRKNCGDLIYAARKFHNFELTFEWKVAQGANSGVFYYVQEIPETPIYFSAPEYQILDNANHPDAKLGKDGNRQSAALYDMIPPNPQNAKSFGEWNTGGITVRNGNVTHYQNGVAVVEYKLWTDAWRTLVDNSKFRAISAAYDLFINVGGPDREGYIGLQNHGNDVWYRNIRVKVLDR